MDDKTKPNRKYTILFSIITIAGTLFICFFISEIAIRIFNPQSNMRERDLFFQYEPFVGFEGIPNKKGIYATRSFKITIIHNSEGFRDVDHDKKNTQNKFRIITLGDSFTWGHGVNNDQIYMKVLEDLNPDIEAINLGGPGGDPPTSLKAYTTWGLDYEHDVVLLGFYVGNDIVAYYPNENSTPPQWGFDSNGKFALIGKMKTPKRLRKSEE